MENTSLTRSLSKVKSKISSKFRADGVSQDDEHVLKVMKYDDTLASSMSPTSSSSSAPAANASSSASLPTATIPTSLPPSGSIPSPTPVSQRQNSFQESRSSSIVLMDPIPELAAALPLVSSNSHQRSASQSTILSELQPSLMGSTDHNSSLQSSRKTSLEDNKEDQLLEQLLPPPPMLTTTSPRITTDLSSPFGQLSPPLSPGSTKIRNFSVVCDPLENIAAVLRTQQSMPTANDFADAMALSILDKVDESTDHNSDWKI